MRLSGRPQFIVAAAIRLCFITPNLLAYPAPPDTGVVFAQQG
jgi:hypothetical protein